MKDQARFADYRFDLSGGALCLDFTNTLGDRPRCLEEHLHAYCDLVSWARQAGLLRASEARELGILAERRPSRARAVLATAVELREGLYRLFAAVSHGEDPFAADVEALNARLAGAFARLRVEPGPERYSWVLRTDREALDRMLWPVIRSAGDLLTSEEARDVRECASDRCSWLFVDRSRTHRRRWCNMKTCGNRAKAQRHYQRVRDRLESRS